MFFTTYLKIHFKYWYRNLIAFLFGIFILYSGLIYQYTFGRMYMQHKEIYTILLLIISMIVSSFFVISLNRKVASRMSYENHESSKWTMVIICQAITIVSLILWGGLFVALSLNTSLLDETYINIFKAIVKLKA